MDRRRLALYLILATFPFAVAAAEPPRPACRAIAGADELLKPGKALLLGEMHGTAESPGFVADLACLAAHAGRSMTVALEIPRAEAPRINAYMASKGSAGDRAALLQGDFWSHQMRDGRSSEAMAGLIETLRKLRQGGAAVQVVPIDPGLTSDAQERDRGMAANLAAALDARSGDVFLSLTGNLHNRLIRGSSKLPEYEWMGNILRQKYADRVLSLNLDTTGGTAWVCFETCGAQNIQWSGKPGDPRITVHPRDESGYDGVYFMGAMTASPPAVPEAKEEKKPGPAGTGTEGHG